MKLCALLSVPTRLSFRASGVGRPRPDHRADCFGYALTLRGTASLCDGLALAASILYRFILI